MKKLFTVLVIALLFTSCKKKEDIFIPRDFKSVEIQTLLDTLSGITSVRAIELKNGKVWFAGSNGITGNENLFDYDSSLIESEVFNHFKNLTHNYHGVLFSQMNSDTTGFELRAVSKINDKYFVITAGSPAILRMYESYTRKIVYKETHEKAFYDSMDFWNDQEGIAIGDPTDNCMSIIITRDGGDTWHKLSCDILPKAKDGEAAFAASDTNIAIVGDHTWVATGGKSSRILYSPDKGESWQVFETPIIQGKETTGIYSIDFYDDQNGFGIGGDYTKAADSSANKIRTQDGGKTWQLVAKNKSPGYRSCVQYVPNGGGKELVALGFKGIDYSNDSGDSWTHLSDEGFYTIRFLNDSIAYAAGRGRITKLTFKE